MNKNDFRNPLIQSGIILLCAFFLISVIVSSPASGFFSGIYAIIVAIFKTILFLFGLSIALACSIAILVGIYLLTLYFYSGDKAQALFNQLKRQLTNLYCQIKSYKKNVEGKAEAQAPEDSKIPAHQVSDYQKVSSEPTPVKSAVSDNRLTALEQKTDEIKESFNSTTRLLISLQADVEGLKKGSSDPAAAPSALESSTKNIAEQLKDQSTALDTISTKIEKVEQQIATDMNSVKKEITDLREKATVPEIVSGILSYIDSPEDRDKLTKKVEEAISRGMTYSQADELFKKSLTAKNYKIVAAHPRLTKDFIRSVKKKFA